MPDADKIFAVIDTNVIVSSLFSKDGTSSPAQVITAVLKGIITPLYNENFPDPDDIVFYEVKMSVDDSFLVTGNTKHFPIEPFVVTPAEMVSILKQKGLL